MTVFGQGVALSGEVCIISQVSSSTHSLHDMSDGVQSVAQSFSHRECQLEQDLDYSQTRRQLSYRRKKEEMKKKLARLEKLQKIIQEKEEASQQGGEGEDGVSSASTAVVSGYFSAVLSEVSGQ